MAIVKAFLVFFLTACVLGALFHFLAIPDDEPVYAIIGAFILLSSLYLAYRQLKSDSQTDAEVP